MKTTKRSLLASGLAVLMCIAMLVGTTFAWFTDSVVNKGNKIQSGRLLINATAYDLVSNNQDGFEIKNGIEGVNGGNPFKFETKGQDLKTDPNPVINEENWEPGKSSAKLLKVENAGTLAAKIKLEFAVTDGGLMDALWFDFIQVDKEGNATGKFEKRPMSELATFAQNLELPVLADGDPLQFILAYGMKEEAGNEYQKKSFSADIAILATQYTQEVDGFGSNQYDKDATYAWDGITVDPITPDPEGNYSVSTASNLAWVAQEINAGNKDLIGKTITLENDVDLNNQDWTPINLKGGISFDGNGHTISNLRVEETITRGYGAGFIGNATGAITIKDLTFDNAYVDTPAANVVGIVMGYSYGTTVFENVKVTNSTVDGFGKVGIMLGMGADPGISVTFKNCVSENNTIKAAYNAGGLAGNIQRKDGVDNTKIENCAVQNNKFVQSPGKKYVTLNGEEATFSSNDKANGEMSSRALSGLYWDDGDYYWGAYGTYYVSYGSSSYDAPITTEGEHQGNVIANSEICVDSVQ